MTDRRKLSLLAQRWREGRVGTHEIMSTNGLWALELAASELQADLDQQPSHLSYDDHAALAARIKALIETDDEDTQDCAIPALDLLRECYVALAQQDHSEDEAPGLPCPICFSTESCQHFDAQQAQPDFTCTSHPCGLVARQAQPECEHGKSDSKP